MVRRGDAANFPNGGFPLGRTSPNPYNTLPALFSMATRPIRQPPATKTDLPCVARLIFLSYLASAYLFPSLPFPSSSSSSSSSIALRNFVLCASASFPLSLFFFFHSRFRLHTRVYAHVRHRGGGEKSCKISLLFSFVSSSTALCFPPLFALSLRLDKCFFRARSKKGKRKCIEKWEQHWFCQRLIQPRRHV